MAAGHPFSGGGHMSPGLAGMTSLAPSHCSDARCVSRVTSLIHPSVLFTYIDGGVSCYCAPLEHRSVIGGGWMPSAAAAHYMRAIFYGHACTHVSTRHRRRLREMPCSRFLREMAESLYPSGQTHFNSFRDRDDEFVNYVSSLSSWDTFIIT